MGGMNVLLVWPEFPDTFWSMKHALRFIRRKALSPPLGLLTVAAMLPREWPKRLVDLNVRPLTKQDLAWADLAMISGMGVQSASARQAIEAIKAAGVRLVAGGPLFTAEPDRFPQVDHLVLNEAELTLPPFLADLAAGRPKRVYTSSGFADLSASPIPMWDLLDFRQYLTIGVQFSRGCPYDCEFCDVTSLFGRRPRTKPPENVIAELDALTALGWHGTVFFVDDNLIGNRLAVRQLLPELADWQRRTGPLAFTTQASLNLADDDALVQLMVRAGFDTVFVGIETPSEAGLQECQKMQNQRRDLLGDVKRLQRAGLQVQAGFIVGFDSDAPSIFAQQVRFIQQSGIVTAMVGMLQAFPGTRLYERLRREGRLLGRPTGDNADGTTNILPSMGMDNLLEGYRSVLQGIYAPRQYYQRIRTFLQEYRVAKVGRQFDPAHLRAFLRSIYELGLLNAGRLHYWRLLLWTLLRRPRAFPLAVNLAICGYHFRRVFERELALWPELGKTHAG